MSKVTLDPTLREQLPDLSRPFVFFDESGEIVGRYIPASFGPPISREEIERRKQTKGQFFSTAEVLARLEAL